MKIYLVRHGETDYNKDGIMQGQKMNIDLNDSGVRQAVKLKNKLKNVDFDMCFTSPLIRSWSTAMIIVGDRTFINADTRLLERSLGEFEGKDKNLYDLKKYWDYFLNSNDNGVEPIQELFKRCMEFVNYIKENYDDKTILVVSHSAITRCLHHILLNTDLKTDLLNFKVDNCYCEEYNL